MSKILSPSQLLEQAEHGDLRPQLNAHAPVNWPLGFDPEPIVPILLKRFFELSRPIADANHEPGLNMRLGDAGRFIYLVDALRRCGYKRVEDSLLMFLDEFCQLEQRAYDELYLWSIVELSRLNREYVARFWPLALTLDLCFRAEPWRRPATATIFEQPYRLTELLMYYYELFTLEREVVPDPEAVEVAAAELHDPARPSRWRRVRRRYPSLLACLRTFFRSLNSDQSSLLLDTLGELSRQGLRADFGDAYPVLLRLK